jgi:LCP family protein required for cell wall assembly
MKSAILRFIVSFLISIIAFGLIAYAISSFVVGELSASFEGGTESQTSAVTDDVTETEEVETLPPDVIEEIKGESFSLLLIGTDYQGELFDDYDVESEYTDTFPQRRNRKVCADTVAIVRFSKEAQKVLITTLPTDFIIKVNGRNTTLGEVYGEQGLDFFINKVTGLTGIELNKYCVINVEDLPEIVDILGGVSFYVPEDMKYEDPGQELTIDLSMGTMMIKGEEAEQLLRFDNYKKSGNSREKTTADFLLALADKLITDKDVIKKADELFEKVVELVTTNYEVTDLIADLELVSYYEDFEKVVMVCPMNTADAIEAYRPYR